MQQGTSKNAVTPTDGQLTQGIWEGSLLLSKEDKDRKWLAEYFHAGTDPNSEQSTPGLDVSGEEDKNEDDDDPYLNPDFPNTFDRILNKTSDKALTFFLTYKEFHQNLSQGTVKGVHTTFKDLWKNTGDRHRQLIETQGKLRGRQLEALTANVKGLHGPNAQLIMRGVSQAQRSPQVAAMHTIWRAAATPQHVTIFDQAGMDHVLAKYLASKKLLLSDHTIAFEIFLTNCKGWQRKVDKGLMDQEFYYA
ncbi:hypothetical protein HD554DRAFT_2034981 [Boletus coccyginus]|nr:hypothetical protein HD554DRAFT_2034981 [Boletus coccyginus]